MLNRTHMESDLVHAKVLKRVIVLLAEELNANKIVGSL